MSATCRSLCSARTCDIYYTFSGLQVGEHILKHTGIEVMKTAGGKLVQGCFSYLSVSVLKILLNDFIVSVNVQAYSCGNREDVREPR